MDNREKNAAIDSARNGAGKGEGGIFVRDICTTIAYVAGVREHHLVLIIQGPHAIILSVGARIDVYKSDVQQQ